MAPTIVRRLINTALGARAPAQDDLAALGPLVAHSILVGRDGKSNGYVVDPGMGAIPPNRINNQAVFAVFGLLGVAFVVVGIWFFFWAKNGGFVFKENDWDDYKSTVMRRKGPNGTTLSGATESTVLGGGSVYKDVDDATEDNSTVISGTTGFTGITGGVSDFSGREKRRKKREQKEREKERRREEKGREKEDRKRGKSSRKVGADGILIDEEAEHEAKVHLRSYRHEKPARVGGINKASEASEWDGSNPSHSHASGTNSGVGTSTTDTGSTVTSELIANRERTPTTTPTKAKREGGERSAGRIRKVYSTADKNASREKEAIRAEARRLQEKGRASAAPPPQSRRDFSWQQTDETMALRRIDEQESVVSGSSYFTESRAPESRAPESRAPESRAPESRAPESRIPGSWAESDIGTASEIGTKVYTHPVHIPVSNGSTATSDFAYADEKRKKRGGAGARRHRGEGSGAA